VIAVPSPQETVDLVRRHARRSGWLRLPDRPEFDVGVKPSVYLPIYEELLGHLRLRRFTILELGVWHGDSLEMWRDAFPRATIVGVDLNPPPMDLGPRVHVVQGDQTDAELMNRLRAQHAPSGFEVIIDDASHMGVTSARSLQHLYRQHLRAGGIYVIEDWGTGYMPSWFDGGPAQEPLGIDRLDASTVPMGEEPQPIPMPSHDIGLVGVVKRLVDHVAAVVYQAHQPEMLEEALDIEWMRVYAGLVALRKPA
jgi:SAM-dependent methyltransferase